MSGLLADGQLSANIPRLDGNATFTGTLRLNNPANSFVGSGSGLTALSASQVASGTLADARLSTNVVTLENLDFVNGTNWGMSTSSADNSVGLSNALWRATLNNSGGALLGIRRVYIPSGTYYFANTVHPLRTDIYGSGSATILVMTNDVDLLRYRNGAECYLHDLVLRGVSGTMQNSCGIAIDNNPAFAGEFIKIDRVFVTYFAHALKLVNTALVSVKDCGFHFQTKGPFLIHTNDTLIVEQCGLGYGTNSAMQGSAPIFNIKGNIKSIKVSSCEIGNFHPFILTDTKHKVVCF